MQHAQDANRIIQNPVGNNIGCAGDHQFPCPLNPSLATAFRELIEYFSLLFDTFIDEDGGPGIILLNEIKNFVPVFDGEQGPLKLHGSFPSALRNAAARRSMKWFST